MEIQGKDYLGLVRSIAKGFENTPRCEHEDYVNIGLLALENAAAHYRPDAGVQFITYAHVFVKRAMAKEFQATKNLLAGITPHKYKNDIEVKELADKTNGYTVSLDAYYKNESKLGDIIASGAAGPEAVASDNEIGKHIHEMIEQLPITYKDIVKMRLLNEETFEFIANEKNTTTNTIAGRYAKALILLQAEAAKRGLAQHIPRD
jgi:RNA polymerase sigma factor (sigma-70 family)